LCQYFGAKKITKPNVTREQLLNLLSYEKLARKNVDEIDSCWPILVEKFIQ